MKKRLYLWGCFCIVLMLCSCGKPENEILEAKQETEMEEVESEVEKTAEEVELLQEPEVTSKISEETVPVLETISTELTTHPILKYTIMGEQRQISYNKDKWYMYDGISEPSSVIYFIQFI